MAVDAAPEAPAKTSQLICPQKASEPSRIDGFRLLGGNATHAFYIANALTRAVLATSGEGDFFEVPAAPSGFGDQPVFTDHAYLSLDEKRNGIATVALRDGLLPRVVRLAPDRKVLRMVAAPQDRVVLLTIDDAVPASGQRLELYRAGAEGPEVLLDTAALASISNIEISGDTVVWMQRSGADTIVKKLSLTTRTLSELVLPGVQDEALQIVGAWIFVSGVGGASPRPTRRYSLTTGELSTTYSHDASLAFLFPAYLAAAPQLVFGARPRQLGAPGACDQPVLYTFVANGAEGTIQASSISANGPLVVVGDYLFFYEERGGCGSHGSPSVPYGISLGCARIAE